ncbi:MAG TPA: protein phosphatase 2C domain-containing protein [Waterburya sp.]
MQCSKCGATVQAGDRFCEECGTALMVEAAIPQSTGGCEKCGAALEEIDAEGYCSCCGFRNQARENDRIEVTCSSKLAGVSDRGLRHYDNEDYVACATVDGKNAYVLVVCDGVSSSQKPELAAIAAAEAACTELTTAIEKGDIKPEEAMNSAFTSALSAVCAIPYSEGTNADFPSTTIVAAVVIDRTATIGWLGDSRAYWISPQGSRQLTKDDSWLYDMVSSGKMTEVQARQSDKAHAITRWLGVDAIADAEPSLVNFNIPGSGYLLLCTDGLWNYAPEPAQITEIVKSKSGADALTVSRSLVEFARRSGGHDNITVAVLSL